jgi:hypothetical protein
VRGASVVDDNATTMRFDSTRVTRSIARQRMLSEAGSVSHGAQVFIGRPSS